MILPAARLRALGWLTAIALAVMFIPVGAVRAQSLNQQAFDYLSINVGSGLSGNAKLMETYDGESADVTGRQSPGIFGSVTIGRSYEGGLGIELEAFVTNNDIKSSTGSDTTYGGLVNLIYTAPRVASLNPYVGVGVGYGGLTYSVPGDSVSTSGLFWQAKAGVLFPVTSTIILDVGYRYLSTPGGHVSSASLGDTKISGDLNILSVGAKVKF